MDMTQGTTRARLIGTAAVGLALLIVGHGTAHAQAAAGAGEQATSDEIVVTARLRSEQALDVPVSIAAVTAAQIDNKGLSNIQAIATQIPALRVDSNIVLYGGSLTIRGVGSATSTASIEQAVSVNIDGIPISYAGVVRLGQFDLGQVEVLRGPQALFFGKNATAGIISLRSAEPTNTLDAMARVGYEFEAGEIFTEGYVSGPLSDTVKVRLAARYSDMDGWIRNIVPAGTPGAFGPHNRKAPGAKETLVKGAITFEPTERLSLKIRGAYGDVDSQGSSLAQRWYCPLGTAQGPFAYPGQECKLDNQTSTGDLNPALHAVDSRFPQDGVPYTIFKQGIVSADLSYELTDGLTLSSLTGYYKLSLDVADHVTFGPIAFVGFASTLRKRTFSEEVRLSSSFDGPFNFMAGLFYQKDRFLERQRTYVGANVVPDVGSFVIHGETISPFVQADFKVIDNLTLSGGVRYSHETKRQSNPIPAYDALLRDKVTFEDWSPEATISWKPAPNINLYGSFKEGYKSGGFQTEWIAIPGALVAGVPVDNSYGPERARGFEIGAKATLMNDALRFNLALFNYKYTGLQLSRFDPVLLTSIISNVGASRSKGVEADVQYRPVPGLTLAGAISYNRSRYLEFISTCYTGQTAARGCDLATNTQNLAGEPLPRAPEWSGNITASYEGLLARDFKYRLNAGWFHTGSYMTMSEAIPEAKQHRYSTWDAGFAIGPENGRWEVAFIGRNLTNKFYASSSGQVPATGSATMRSDLFTTVNRGRELTARLTFRPF